MGCMNSDLSEALRAIKNLIRFGVITEVNGDRARVQLAPNLCTTWLQWFTLRAGNSRTWFPPSEGEQVAVFSPDGDLTQGKILAGLFTADSPAPESSLSVNATHYPDGAVVRYDHETHALSAILPDGSAATVKANTVTSDADTTICTGDVDIKGNLTVKGVSALNNGVTVKGGDGGAAMKINGSVEATGDVKAGDISLKNHPHEKVQPGNGTSGGPIA